MIGTRGNIGAAGTGDERMRETADDVETIAIGFERLQDLGELEAGLVANAMGPTVAVVTGGIGCLIATVWVAARTPALRGYRRTVVPDAAEDLAV